MQTLKHIFSRKTLCKMWEKEANTLTQGSKAHECQEEPRAVFYNRIHLF